MFKDKNISKSARNMSDIEQYLRREIPIIMKKDPNIHIDPAVQSPHKKAKEGKMATHEDANTLNLYLKGQVPKLNHKQFTKAF